MQELLNKYENKRPEIVFEWQDSETEAEGWVVINSLRGGAAGGGTRMRKGLDKREVESLAKTMEVKFTVSGPPIGGAKSGINFDPNDPRKHGVLQRWYRAVFPLLKNYYGTGGDMNVDEIHEVIPITEEYGLWHPQEGIVSGHMQATKPQMIKKLGQLRQGVSKVLEDPQYTPDPARKYVVADMITGFGVAEAVRHYYDIYGGDVKGKRVVVQGWGNVGSAAAYYLSMNGARIVGIIDREGGLINQEGYAFEEIRELFLRDQVDRMIKTGIEVISCGANVPFADPEIFFGPTGVYADEHISIIPDFIANCGMARVFAYLMGDDVELTDQAIFEDTSETIRKAIQKTHDQHKDKTQIAKTSFELALSQLV